eukprot:TRINITY_DN18386_c0_g1_i1.p1 TRINITY_DN18386_c0_g1~~TRINITY_DN18386_c0_g1_i1.p1  ORF type:complete len:458 (-),score=65.94 TRINITY_DN18386_c0_g1_i1:245-1618(-)
MTGHQGLHSLFTSVEDYSAYMIDPLRVIRLEWRKARQRENRDWTSHSWLEANLLNGQQLRLELFANHGFTRSTLKSDKVDANSKLYNDRAAESHEFALPLTADVLESMASEIAASSPHSLGSWNCHHFAFEVWNAVVIPLLRTNRYPDLIKSKFLWSWEDPLGDLLDVVVPPSIASTSLEPATHRWLGLLRPPADAGSFPCDASLKSPCTKLSGTYEEGERFSGELESVARDSVGFDRVGRLKRFRQLVCSGAVFVLETASDVLVPTNFPVEEQCRTISDRTYSQCEAWADVWLPSAGAAAMRVVERVGTTDVVDLVARVLKPSGELVLNRPAWKRALPWLDFTSLSSSSMWSRRIVAGQKDPVDDVCFVLLQSKQELRLAIYAVLRAIVGQGKCEAWRLRLLSGNAHTDQEATFTYTSQEIPHEASATTASDLAREEMPSLKAALSTGDWGFVTLL